MRLNWDDLKVVLAVARAGSLAKAAPVLGVDQSTAGRRLTALEADLGTILFIRSKRGFTPTQAGQVAIEQAHLMEKGVDRLSEALSQETEGPSGTVRLMGNAWTLNRLTLLCLRPFLTRYPNLDVRIITVMPRVPLPGDATLSLWFETLPKDAEFVIPLGEVPYAVYAARSADPATLGWLSFFDEDAPGRAPVKAWERLRKEGEPLRLTATDAMILLTATRSGVGKALLPMCLGESDPDIVRVTEGPPDLRRTLHAHVHPDSFETQRIQATIEWLRSCFAEGFLPSGQVTG